MDRPTIVGGLSALYAAAEPCVIASTATPSKLNGAFPSVVRVVRRSPRPRRTVNKILSKSINMPI
jgi:hypothetical protein